MTRKCDVMITGTGNFAERMGLDIALTAAQPIRITFAARKVEEGERLEWLRLAGNARAAIAERPAYFDCTTIDWQSPESIAETLDAWKPDVIVHAASVQPPAVVIDRVTEWGRIAFVGTISLTVPIQAILGSRLGKAMALCGSKAVFMNCCYPDVTNPVLKAMGLPVVCGAGNLEILASAFAGELGIRRRGAIKLLAHHQNLRPWRGPAAERGKTPPPRVWIEGNEIDDVYQRFARVRLTLGPAIPISGCTGMPIILSFAGHRDYVGHVTGPHGLPGGYPVTIKNRVLELSLPEGVGRDQAIAWNERYEKINGLTVENGRVVFNGRLREELARHSPSLAHGFRVDDLDRAAQEFLVLRDKLEKQTASSLT